MAHCLYVVHCWYLASTFVSQAVAQVLSTGGRCASHGVLRDNMIYFGGVDSLTWSQESYSISTGQPFKDSFAEEKFVDESVQWTAIDVVAGSCLSRGPARNFSSGIRSTNMIASGKGLPQTAAPRQLDFVVFGTMTFVIKGKTYECKDMRIGQGKILLQNNWWIGGPHCVDSTATQLNCGNTSNCGLTFNSLLNPFSKMQVMWRDYWHNEKDFQQLLHADFQVSVTQDEATSTNAPVTSTTAPMQTNAESTSVCSYDKSQWQEICQAMTDKDQSPGYIANVIRQQFIGDNCSASDVARVCHVNLGPCGFSQSNWQMICGEMRNIGESPAYIAKAIKVITATSCNASDVKKACASTPGGPCGFSKSDWRWICGQMKSSGKSAKQVSEMIRKELVGNDCTASNVEMTCGGSENSLDLYEERVGAWREAVARGAFGKAHLVSGGGTALVFFCFGLWFTLARRRGMPKLPNASADLLLAG